MFRAVVKMAGFSGSFMFRVSFRIEEYPLSQN